MTKTILNIVLFLFATISVLLLSHFFVYYSIIYFFKITNYKIKISIGLGLFLLGISFMIYSILSHYFDNTITRYLYFCGGMWLGILTNLVLVFILVWIVFFVKKYLNFELNFKIIGIIGILIAITLSGYGIINAYYNIQVKNISVNIKNLPTYWQDKIAVQISDVHLGHIYRKEFLERAVNKINEINPDIIFITGDLFDGMDGNLDDTLEVTKKLNPKDGIYFVYGNHEKYFGIEKTKELLNKYKINILDNALIDIEGLQIIGFGHSEQKKEKDIDNTFSKLINFDPSTPSILLYHSPVNISEIKSHGINLQLSGHSHAGQFFPFGLVTKAFYKGYDYGLKVEGDYSIYTTSGLGTWGPTMRTGKSPEIVKIILNKQK